MKKWARTAAVMMSVVMLSSVTACGKAAQDPKAALDAALKKNAELTSLDMDTAMDMTMTQGEQNVELSMEMNMKMTDINQDTMQYLAAAHTSVLGQSIDMTIFYTDGCYYMETMGQKVKYPMDLVQIMETVKKNTEGSTLTSEQMTEVTMAEEGDKTVISFTADPAKMNAYISDALGSIAVAGLEDMEMTVREAGGSYTLNQDGYYTDMSVKMSVDMTVQGESVTVTMDMTGRVNAPGQPVTVELPSTDGYTEIDPPAAAA